MNTTWDVVELIAMALETCIMETGDGGHDWRVKLHIPKQQDETFVDDQEFKFKAKWEELRPDVSVEWSDKYHKSGDLSY
eukprot:8851864-Prorocentrum_lima.AAC.1